MGDTNVCEYCDEPASDLPPSETDGGVGPVFQYDAGDGTTAGFHADCHKDMMTQEICGEGLDEDGEAVPS
jgi:hypothetical protein